MAKKYCTVWQRSLMRDQLHMQEMLVLPQCKNSLWVTNLISQSNVATCVRITIVCVSLLTARYCNQSYPVCWYSPALLTFLFTPHCQTQSLCFSLSLVNWERMGGTFHQKNKNSPSPWSVPPTSFVPLLPFFFSTFLPPSPNHCPSAVHPYLPSHPTPSQSAPYSTCPVVCNPHPPQPVTVT